MTEFLTITCPHCFEDSQVQFDPDEGSSEFVLDCQVCCRPMTIHVRMSGGEVQEVQISGE